MKSTTSKNHQGKSFNPSRKVILTGVILIVLLLIGLLGLQRLANGSTPKAILYPVDRAFEQLRRAITLSPVSRANLALDSFNERQHEAQSLVLSSDYNVCDTRNSAINSENDEAILKVLNTSQENLAQAEAEILQVKDGVAKEELNARLVQVVGHHLQIWEALSKFVPVQSVSALKQSTDIMTKSLDRSFRALPEGRKNDLTTQLRFNLPAVVDSINSKLGICEEKESTSEESKETGGTENGSTGNATGTGSSTSNSNTRTTTGSTGRTGATGSTGAAGRPSTPGTSGSTGTSGNNGSNGNNGGNTGATGDGVNVNVNSDAGVNVDAGINDQGQLYLEPTIAPNLNNGTDSNATVNDSNVVDTNACPGPQVLGVCL